MFLLKKEYSIIEILNESIFMNLLIIIIYNLYSKIFKKNTTILNEIYKKKENFVTDTYELFQNYLKFIDINMQYEYKNTLVNTTTYQKTLCYYLSKYYTIIIRIFLSSQEINNRSNIAN